MIPKIVGQSPIVRITTDELVGYDEVADILAQGLVVPLKLFVQSRLRDDQGEVIPQGVTFPELESDAYSQLGFDPAWMRDIAQAVLTGASVSGLIMEVVDATQED